LLSVRATIYLAAFELKAAADDSLMMMKLDPKNPQVRLSRTGIIMTPRKVLRLRLPTGA
jgi:hypothetical protein